MFKKFTIDSPNENIKLKNFDPNDTAGISREDIESEYVELQQAFVKLQDVLFASKKYALLIVLQGMDSSGKDSTVKKVLTVINPNGVNIDNFKVPTPLEMEHDFLWRIHNRIPAKGDISVFNRSHYEDVLVTRVHKIIDDSIAKKRFQEINDFEKYLVGNKKTVKALKSLDLKYPDIKLNIQELIKEITD